MTIHKTLGEDLQGIHEDLLDFGRRFARIHKILGEDLRDFGRGFVRICKTLGEDS